KAIYLSLPIFVGVAINDINAIVDKRLASYLVKGSISALNYANKLKSLILSIFISAITTVVYPMLSREVSDENMDGVKKIINYGVDLIFLITIPATVGIVILAEPIVKVAFQKGEFDSLATMMTAQALLFYSISIVISALRSLVTRVYYSLHDTKTPTINSAITVATNIVFNLILMGPMGHAGLALATSISITPSTIWMYYRLRNKIGNLGLKSHLTNGLKISAISLVMGVISYFSYNGFFQLFGPGLMGTAIALGLAVFLSVIAYGTMCYVFNVNVVRDMVNTGTYNLKKLVSERKK
ncbi:MAG TPA: lipid II flippase MurJ, partial [Tissierellaceae bacterium]|nr:lipid II flippase MurJ [Tissierellaceae bacterium]